MVIFCFLFCFLLIFDLDVVLPIIPTYEEVDTEAISTEDENSGDETEDYLEDAEWENLVDEQMTVELESALQDEWEIRTREMRLRTREQRERIFFDRENHLNDDDL